MTIRARRHALLLPVFFLSGCAALVYQMVWQRVLTFFSGADVVSVTLIVAAFMAGLGFGSLAGGSLADRLSLRGRFAAFAAAELAVAAFAFVSLPLFYDGLYLRLGERALPGALMGLVLFATLLWPTFFMGLSLPLLARTIAPTGERPEDWVGRLYDWNTLGAAFGSLAAVWWLVRAVGFTGGVQVAAALNVACALVALALAWRTGAAPVEGAAERAATPAASADVPAEPAPFGLRTFALLFGLSGFVALSLEIVWFRMLGVILKSNAFTFATLLAVYLLGVGGGALAGSRLARRSARPTRVFLLLQALVPAYAALALALFVRALPGWPALHVYLGGYETIDLRHALPALERFLALQPLDAEAAGLVRLFGVLYVLVPLALFGPATVLMGLAFPFLQKAAQTDPGTLGRRVGLLQAANIVGCTLGSIVTGLVLLDLLGSAATLRLLAGVGGGFAALLLVGARREGAPRGGMALGATALALALLAVAVTPDARGLWAALHGAQPADVLAGEDASGLSVLRDRREGGRTTTVVFASGLGQSLLPYGGEHTLLGAFPVLLHPEPREVAIVGLGSGDTLFGAAARSETTRLDCVEIVAPQLGTLRRLAETHPYGGLRRLLGDPRVRHVVGDGRAFLMRSAARYDVVEADALRPTSAFSGSLYSLEYFELLRARLKPGGYAVSWGPTPRIRATFRQAFPHVLVLNQVLVGSDREIAFDRARLRARLAEPFTQAPFAAGEVDAARLFDDFLAGDVETFGPGERRPGTADLNTDLFPRDEYLVPRLRPRARR